MIRYVQPLLKWPGGKTGELDTILPRIPRDMTGYREPFVGGGAVLWNIPSAVPAIIGDASVDLISFYGLVKSPTPSFESMLDKACSAWEASDTSWEEVSDIMVLSGLTPDGWNGGMPISRARGNGPSDERHDRKAALYNLWREGFNARLGQTGEERAVGFWLMRELAYNGMFRSNSKGGFNVPYGGRSYDGRNLRAKAARITSPLHRDRLTCSTLVRGDFASIVDGAGDGDFVFLDPPYDSPFSSYDGNGFGRKDHTRLASALDGLAGCAKWMLVIASTPFVEETYLGVRDARVLLRSAIRYKSNIKNRYEGRAEHLVVTNYLPG